MILLHVNKHSPTQVRKRKYNKGKRVGDGTWVVNGLVAYRRPIGNLKWEPMPGHKVIGFSVPVKDRNKEVLHAIIQKHVHRSAYIVTDKWKGYLGLEEAGLCKMHFQVQGLFDSSFFKHSKQSYSFRSLLFRLTTKRNGSTQTDTTPKMWSA